MKTFETEKHNIPEGATHYRDATKKVPFFWFKNYHGIWYLKDASDSVWYTCECSEWKWQGVKPIPQTNIETPEEKEVEWVNGDDVEAYGKLYKYVGLDPFNDNLCICLANQDDDPQCFSIEVLNKPETEAERVEREELELGESLMNAMKKSFPDSINHCSSDLLKWASVAKSIGYRKESEL